jgi:hypothetical protein
MQQITRHKKYPNGVLVFRSIQVPTHEGGLTSAA